MRRGILLGLFGLGCALVGGFVAQLMAPPTALERELAYHSPEGIVQSVSGEDRSRPEELRQILETMQIQPGTSILDLGAGTGIFTFLFADLLDGTGSIHATDVEPDLIELLEEQVEVSGHQNIHPTLVGADGLDPFYTQHSWDLIFLSGVYVYLPHRQDYFSELRASLRPSGRLFVVLTDRLDHRVLSVRLKGYVYGNFDTIVAALQAREEDFPIHQRLSPEMKHYLAQGELPGNATGTARDVLVRDLSEVLGDRFLFDDLEAYFKKSERTHLAAVLMENCPEDLSLVRWLATRLGDDGVFGGFREDRQQVTLSEVNLARVHKLNGILLSAALGIVEYTPPGAQVRIINPRNVISTLEAAGYRFVRSYEFLERRYLLEFGVLPARSGRSGRIF